MKCLICDAEFHHNQLKFHLRKEHNLDVAEYYLKYILETDEIPKCVYCGGDSKFLKFSRGYSIYCSKNCRSKHNIGILNKDPEFQRLANEGQLRALKENPEFFELKARVARENVFKTFDDSKDMLLYFIDLGDKVKVGVSKSEQVMRGIVPSRVFTVCRDSKRLGKSDTKLITLIRGSLSEVYPIESNIIEQFSEHRAEGVEYFKKEVLEDILKFINDNISSSTTIETLDVEEINKALQSKE